MARTISLKIGNASTSKHNDTPPPGDKTLELESDICFYEIERGDKTE